MVISPENILLVGAILLFLSVLVGKTGGAGNQGLFPGAEGLLQGGRLSGLQSD